MVGILCDWVGPERQYRLPARNSLNLSGKTGRNLRFINPESAESEWPLADCKSFDVYCGNRINNRILERFENLKLIQFGSVGIDKISPVTIQARQLTIANAGKVFVTSVASYTLARVLDWFRADYILGGGMIDSRSTYEDRLADVYGSQSRAPSGIILGKGNIATAVGLALESLGFDVQYLNRSLETRDLRLTNNINNLRLKNASFVVNLLPLTADTVGLVDKNFFSRVNSGRFGFFNVGRAETVVTDDLLFALERMSGLHYWTDVADSTLKAFAETELGSNMIHEKRLFISPHIAAFNCWAWDDLIDLCVSNIKFFESGILVNDLGSLIYWKGERVNG